MATVLAETLRKSLSANTSSFSGAHIRWFCFLSANLLIRRKEKKREDNWQPQAKQCLAMLSNSIWWWCVHLLLALEVYKEYLVAWEGDMLPASGFSLKSPVQPELPYTIETLNLWLNRHGEAVEHLCNNRHDTLSLEE